jgi:hypothetical protein
VKLIAIYSPSQEIPRFILVNQSSRTVVAEAAVLHYQVQSTPSVTKMHFSVILVFTP